MRTTPFWKALCLASAVAMLSAGSATAQPLSLEVVEARLAYDQRTGQALITIKFSEAARAQFARLTTENVARAIEMRVDGKTYLRTIIREPIIGGSGQIVTETEAQAKELAARLSSPGAKIEIEVVP